MSHISAQFFHEVDESEQWMEEDLKKLNDKFHTSRQIKGDYDNAKRLLEELQVRWWKLHHVLKCGDSICA